MINYFGYVRICITSLMVCVSMLTFAKKNADNANINFNPIIPDFVADPSVVKFGDTFYLYGTTDIDQGLGKMGMPVVWKSKDFVNWSFEGTIMPQIKWDKPYSFTDKKGDKKEGFFRYWAPGKALFKNNKYYLYPTIVKPDGNLGTYVVVSDTPEGPFYFPNGKGVYFGEPDKLENEAPKLIGDIDGEPFVDNNGDAYIYWRRRFASKLSADLLSCEGETVSIYTDWKGYSEGPLLFRRGDIYYYIYTLAGHASYCNGYMYSRESPLGKFETPKNSSIFINSDVETSVWGPGHGNVFQMPGTDDFYFLYLEYGEGGTTRQVYVNKMTFDTDGMIQPMALDKNGVGYLLPNSKSENLAYGCSITASSSKEDKTVSAKIVPNPNTIAEKKISARSGDEVERVFSYSPSNVVDMCNGTRWMANETDEQPWIMVDLGKKQTIEQCEFSFVFPTFGHSWKLEKSMNGETWESCNESTQEAVCSPHVAKGIGKARYLRLTITDGIAGLWEFKVF